MTTIRKRPLRASASLFPASASMLQSRRRLNVCDSSIYTAPALVTFVQMGAPLWLVECSLRLLSPRNNASAARHFH